MPAFQYSSNAQRPWDLSGDRLFVLNREDGRREIWSHPFRLVKNFRPMLLMAQTPDSAGLLPLLSYPHDTEVWPSHISTEYELPSGKLHEVVILAPDGESVGFFYQLEGASTGAHPPLLAVQWSSDLRRMWPYSTAGSGDFLADIRKNGQEVRLRSGDFQFTGGLFSSAPPQAVVPGEVNRWRSEGSWEPIAPRAAEEDVFQQTALYHLTALDHASPGTDAALALIFHVNGDSGCEKARDFARNPDDWLRATVAQQRALLDSSLQIVTPDEAFNKLWQWAVLGASRFSMTTPGVGTGLVAGIGGTDRGWDGGHEVNGRPGYAWYFGRDAAWAGLALNATGLAGQIRPQLELFKKYQDPSGKIYHELTTSGVVHYDASDATPLYVILLADYLRNTGDLPTIREHRTSLLLAMDHLLSTDTDGDGWIENTDEGHGWVEGGVLWGAHTTTYLASLWVRTLGDAAFLLEEMDSAPHRAARFARLTDSLGVALRSTFWSDSATFYAQGLYADGSLLSEPTILPAVPASFRQLPPERVRPMLRAWAGNGFSTNWGLRILSANSELFKGGYHSGTVWPLFTGWVALAEYAYGNHLQGFGHLMDNLLVKNHWSPGYVEEVLKGDAYEPGGVCHHQLWSETMVLLPAVRGMVGWQVEAKRQGEGRADAELHPRIPAHWDSISVNNLRWRGQRIQMEMRRDSLGEAYTLLNDGPAPLLLHFQPHVDYWRGRSRLITAEDTLDWQEVMNRGVQLSLKPGKPTEVFVQHESALLLQPLVQRPEPGDGPQGPRILQTTVLPTGLLVELELPPGDEQETQLMGNYFGEQLPECEGGILNRAGRNRFRISLTQATDSETSATVQLLLYYP